MLDRLQSSPTWQKGITAGLLCLLALVSIAVCLAEYSSVKDVWQDEHGHISNRFQTATTALSQDVESIGRLLVHDSPQSFSQARSYLMSRPALMRSIQWIALLPDPTQAPVILHYSPVLGGFALEQDPAIVAMISHPSAQPVMLAVPETYKDSVTLAIAYALPDRRGHILALLDGREMLRDVMSKWPHPVLGSTRIDFNSSEIAFYPLGASRGETELDSEILLGQNRLRITLMVDPPSLLSLLFRVRVSMPILSCVGVLIVWLLLLRSWHSQALTPSHIPPGMGFAVVQTRRRHMEITKASPALAHLLGIEIDQVEGRPLIALICGEMVDLPPDGVLHPTSPTARAKWLRLTISPSAQQQQLVLIEDVTDQRQQELRTYRRARLKQLAQMIGQMSHDLKQPLNIIRLTAENALSSDADPHSLRHGLTMAVEQSARAHEMIDRTRDAARQPLVPPAPLVVVTVLRSILDQMKDRIDALNIQLTWHPDLSTPMVLGHEGRFSLALQQFLLNACDALSLRDYQMTGDQPSLRVSCHNQHGHVLIVIEDNGPGMPQTVMDAIRTAHPVLSAAGDATLGLGLTMALGVIAEMDGDADVSSSPDGTVISLRLPPVQRQWSHADRLADTQRVLVVDDEQVAASQIADFLNRKGWTCKIATGGNHAWAMFSDFAPHAVITDLHMPDGNGWDLIHNIHSLSPDTPIIVVSSAEGADTKRAIRAGATLFLEKPASLDEIYQELTDLATGADF